MDKLSFLKGLALGLAGKPLEFALGKEPIGFLYGREAKEGETPTHIIDDVDYVGAILPPLPEWDKTAYPYAFLVEDYFGEAYHMFLTAEPTYHYNTAGNWSVSFEKAYQYAPATGWSDYDTTINGVVPDVINWANFDLMSEDEKVYLEGTEPIPIYE